MRSNYFILFLLVLLNFGGYAQLTIRNNAYVYASDMVVFVNDQVNIQESTARFYLRDEAQLLQGTGTVGNSGTGLLSVYQWGTVNEYAYNYWCSPVGNTLTNSVGNRPFRPNNNIYEVMSAPTTSSPASFTSGYDGTSSPLVISNYWIWKFDPGTAYSEWDYVGDSGDVAAAYGFTMKGTNGSGNNQMYDFRGKPNSGTISTSVLAEQQTLVGNPYPSALDTRDFIWDTDNQNAITGYLYYWEQAPGATSHFLSDYVGGYASYTISSDGFVDSFTPAAFTTYLSNGIPTNFPAGSGNKIAKRHIPIGQGFMVEGKTGSTGVAYFKNAHRDFVKESDGNSFFFRNQESDTNLTNTTPISYDENGLTIVPEDYQRFRINVDFNDTHTRQLLMNFHESASNGFDYGLEAKSPEVLSSDAHWTWNNDPYCIQAYNFDQELHIPLIVKSNSPQLIRFRIFDIQNFDEAQPIYLHDMLTDSYVNLREQNLELMINPENYNDRFEITFTQEALSMDEPISNSIVVFHNQSKSEIIIKNPNYLNLQQVSLYDITGKEILNDVDLSQNQEYHYSTKDLISGAYIVHLVLDTEHVVSKKIIVGH